MLDRLAELEIKISYQEHTIAELNEVVTRQQSDLDRLRKDVAGLKAQFQALGPSNLASEAEETPPPHY